MTERAIRSDLKTILAERDCYPVDQTLDALAERAIEFLREAAEELMYEAPWGSDIRPDGTLDPVKAAYVDGWRDAVDLLLARVHRYKAASEERPDGALQDDLGIMIEDYRVAVPVPLGPPYYAFHRRFVSKPLSEWEAQR